MTGETVTLVRTMSSDHGMVGRLHHRGWCCHTMEPPWRDNQPRRSCIPWGAYPCRWHRSPRYGWVYLVTEVPGRSHILIHPGNVGGDREAGYHTHTLGCLLLGHRAGHLVVRGRRQRAVLASRPTVREFFRRMHERPFTLEIVDE